MVIIVQFFITGVRSPSEVRDFSSSLCVQTSCEAHSASYPMDTGNSFLGWKSRLGRDFNHSPHLVSKSGLSRSNNSSPLVTSIAVLGQIYYQHHHHHLLSHLPLLK
jgi:hypothetical protein